MCRLAMLSKEGVDFMQVSYGLKNFLDYLIESFGGHGNGVAFIKEGKIIKFRRGVKLSTEKIVELSKKTDFDWMFFHTRMASVGEISSRNCHPFRADGNLMAMNGTLGDFKILANHLDCTDTEAMFRTGVKFNLDMPEFSKDNSATFIGYDKKSDGVFCTSHSRWNDLEILVDNDNNPLIFASEFPVDFGYKIYYPASYPFIWREGDDISDMVSETKLTYSSHYLDSYYGYGYDDYGTNDTKNAQSDIKDTEESLTEEDIKDGEDAFAYLDKFYDYNEEKGIYEPKKGVVLE